MLALNLFSLKSTFSFFFYNLNFLKSFMFCIKIKVELFVLNHTLDSSVSSFNLKFKTKYIVKKSSFDCKFDIF